METKFAIDQKDGDYSDEKYFRRLIRSIEVSQKYFLFFVACNQIPRQNELIAEIKAELPTKNIEVINFKEPITDLLYELETILADKKPDAIFVQGLGNSISSDGTGDANNLIYALNISRDSFNDALPCPIYLWLPEYAVIKITRHAPDFFSVRSGVFYFSSSAEQVISDIFQSTSSEWLETSSLPVADKQKRIAMLESLLAEYQGLEEEKRDQQAEMRLYEQLADLFYSISEYKKAIEYNELALRIAIYLGDRKSEGKRLRYLGHDYKNLGEYDKAILLHSASLSIAQEIDDREGESSSLNGLGSLYLIIGKYKTAKGYYTKSLAIAREIGNERDTVSRLSNLGRTHIALENYENAIDYYEQALKIAITLGDRKNENSILGNLGVAYKNLGEYQKAIEYSERALLISTEIGNRQGEGIWLANLGNTYFDLGEKEKAKNYLQQALAIFEAIESPNAEVVRQNLARLE